jgi:hypothetical protein
MMVKLLAHHQRDPDEIEADLEVRPNKGAYLLFTNPRRIFPNFSESIASPLVVGMDGNALATSGRVALG